MPIYLVGNDGSLLGWGSSPADTTPPPAPTGVTATAGDGEVLVDWTANASDTATYRVVRSRNNIIAGTVTHPTSQLNVTGLNNGTRYYFQVYAIDAAGNISAPSTEVSAIPSPASVITKYGYNVDNPLAPLSGRLAKWDNRAPLIRNYYGTNWINGNFGLSTGTHPERGTVFTWKAGGFSTSQLAAGAGNARLKDWLESIPGNPNPWDVKFGFHHEVNSATGIEVPYLDYLAIYEQMRSTLDDATLQPGVSATLWCNFMAYQIGDGTGTGFKDIWVPDPSVCHGISWDVYLNPGNFTSQVLAPNCGWSGQPNPVTGAEYGSSFPNTATRHRDWMRATIRNGYGDDGRWAVWEYNGPPREFDGPANPDYVCGSNKRLRYQGGRTASGHDNTHTEVERAAALVAGLEYFQSRPQFTEGTLGLPDHVLFWEHPEGVNWNQKFYHDNVWNALKPYLQNSPGAL